MLRRLAVSATRIAHAINRLPIHCVVNGLHGFVAPCTSATHPFDHTVHEQKYRRRASNARTNAHGKK
jgi:hypothetical protein